MLYQQIIGFWFGLEPKQWWQKNDELDQQIKQQFLICHTQAVQGELFQWRETPLGRLAEVIVIDQFSRNIYRGDPRSYAYDSIALVLSQEAISQGADQALKPEERSFLYLPFMHSESSVIHQQAVELFSVPGLENNLDFEHQHKSIIDRFNRYPHRNAVLGRNSTPEELEFLQQPNSSF